MERNRERGRGDEGGVVVRSRGEEGVEARRE